MANQNPATHNWTEERTELLRQMVREGYSGGLIAARLGISRNAVIGKTIRIGMRLGNSRNSMQKSVAAKLRLKVHRVVRAKSARLKAPAAKVKFPVEALPPPNIEDVPRKKLADLGDNDCRYPVNHVGDADFGFCALEQMPGSVYCAAHHSRCRVAPIIPRKVNLTIVADTSAPVKEGADA